MMSFSPHRSCTLYKNNMRSIVKNKYLKTIYTFPLSSFLKAQIQKTAQIMIEETSKRFWGVTRTTSVGADNSQGLNHVSYMDNMAKDQSHLDGCKLQLF